ncbi:MAG TPA: hypothetical protein PKK00_03835 [Bacteroidales bacterium]|nr:hypothetical protein [Bacteroidales bacterium]HNW97528.1 hypothetical protein [Bacteroidales bacterium]HPS16564.1 hypothetical protein [Bacteroidales bacterium]HPS16572.1 hypothetical protein [Bacteroidales bacterium]
MEQLLNTQNPEHITWKYEQLSFAILGGIRLEGLDRLRVTIKTEFKTIAIRHNLDLYNDGQLEKLVRKYAERFEIGTVYLSKVLGELINRLENYRMQEIKNSRKSEVVSSKILTEEEKEAAISFLKSNDLLLATNDLIGKTGMIGEEHNRLLMYLIFTSRKREYPLHVVSLASSGTGKSYLQEKVSELIPEEDRIEITTLSENALYYFGQQELKHKLILIEDLDGAESVLYPLRELKSKRKITKTVTLKDNKGNTKTVHLTVEGPVSVAGCTTQESIYEDNANRSFLIYLDESKEQDEKIMNYQRKLSAGTVNFEEEHRIKELMKNVQRILQPVSIRNPYAEMLQIPQEVFKPRRTNSHYLQFIEAITFYKQYQREQKADEETGEVYIETTLEDIQEANSLMKEILLRKSDELNGACRNYFEQLKIYLQQRKLQLMTNDLLLTTPPVADDSEGFTSKEISKALRIPVSTVKRHHLHLFTNGYIKHYTENKKTEKAGKGLLMGSTGKSYCYEIISYEEYKQLQSRISTALDEALNKVRAQQLTGSNAAHCTTEPIKPNSSKEKKQRLKKPTTESKGIEKTHNSELITHN